MKDPKKARAIMIVVIVISILLGGYRALSSEASKVENVFFNGVDGDGIGINSDLSHRVDISQNLISVAKRYLPAGDTSILDLVDASSRVANSSNPSDKLRANRELQLAFSSLSEKLDNNGMNEKDKRYLENLKTDFISRNHIISLDGYNQKAVDFNIQLARFPANILGSITGIKPFELAQ